MLVPMELARIIISEIAEQHVIYLREVEGDRIFPILIGLFEAHSIDRRVKISEENPPPPRPLTHDLIKNVIEELGGIPQDVVINNLMDHTYYAIIRIEKEGELIEIDSRPSDAIALAMHYDPPLPIYVDDSVLDEVVG
ncbi:MAG: bifunctional nuclease family protein [Planctomycetes bacterium]|nr:bifunctional nuclease family protein [Planctomycetota bacterium]